MELLKISNPAIPRPPPYRQLHRLVTSADRRKVAGEISKNSVGILVAMVCSTLVLTLSAGSFIFIKTSESETLKIGDATSEADRPNVLLILTDDQRNGSEIGMTAVREKLIARGIRFVNAIVPTSICCPSRATLLTGKYAHTTGVWDNHYETGQGGWPTFQNTGSERHTVAGALDTVGYHTGYFGKYLNDSHRMPLNYKPPGWDSFHIMRKSGDGYTEFVTSDGKRRKQYSTDYFGQKTLKFIQKTSAETPFFAVYAPFAPHSKYVPGPYEGQAKKSGNLQRALAEIGWPNEAVNRNNLAGKPHWLLDWPTSNFYDGKTKYGVSQMPEAQLDTLQGIDANIASILDYLDSEGRLENTLIVFTSDNGYSWGENRLRQKYTPHKANTEVPLVVRWDAGNLPLGRVENALVAANLDVNATILEVAGAALPGSEGISLLGGLSATRGITLEAKTWRVIRRPAYCGYRTEDWMFTRYSTGEEELYHYPSDPWESNNLAYSTDPADKAPVDYMRQQARTTCKPLPAGFTWVGRKPGISLELANRNLYRAYPRWFTPPKPRGTPPIPGR